MGGTWSPTSPPADPGFYVNFEALATATVSGGQTGVVLMPLHDAVWGPVGKTVELYSLAEYDRVFSKGECGARESVARAFTGTGYAPGAERVLVHRVISSGTGDTAKATVAGMEFEGRYVGNRINGWNLSLTNVPGTTEYEFVLMDGEIERWRAEFDAEDIPAVDAAIAALAHADSNNWFVMTPNSPGYDGSNDDQDFDATGSALPAAGSDVADFVETELINNDYNVVTSYDAGIGAVIAEAAIEDNLNGKRFLAVVGGGDEDIDTACAAAVDIGNENVVRVGYTILEQDGEEVLPEAFAPQLAGIIAANGPFRSITASHVAGMSVKKKAGKSELRKARNAGLVMLVEDQIGARLYQDMTTYTSDTIYKPRKEFGVIKAVMVHHQIETDLTRAAEGGWIGGANVNTANYRRAVLDGISGYLARVEGAAMILPGWEVGLDEMYDNTGDSIHIKYGIKTSRVVERILNTIVLH